MPKFSVIIPIYNCAQHLSISVESVINQSYADWELILVNDGSRDDSLEICYKYAEKDNRIVVINQINAGAGPARNTGISVAQGDYIIFCDADDSYCTDAFQKLAVVINRTKADLIIGGYNHISIDTNNNKSVQLSNTYLSDINDIKRNYISLLNKNAILTPWAKAYKRSVILEYGIHFSDLRRSQDVVFNLDFYDKIQSLCVIDSCLYNYFVDECVYWKKIPVSMFEINKAVYLMTIDKFKEWGCCDEKTLASLNIRYLYSSVMLIRLNYMNNWNLESNKRKAFTSEILNDSSTIYACRHVPSGIKSNLVRILVLSKSRLLMDLFSQLSLWRSNLKKRK